MNNGNVIVAISCVLAMTGLSLGVIGLVSCDQLMIVTGAIAVLLAVNMETVYRLESHAKSINSLAKIVEDLTKKDNANG